MICMTACGDLVISGHMNFCLRVWNTATGGCDHVLRGHTDAVECITSWEQYLVSGSHDNTVKVWSTEVAGLWPCLCTIAVHTGDLIAMDVWEGRVISGSNDATIVASDIITRQHEATLNAHTDHVRALAVSGRTLLSTGDDCTISVWALGTWSHLRVVRVSELVPDVRYCLCLAVSGSMLLCGGECDDQESGFVLVLDSHTTSPQHTLQLDCFVEGLLSMRGKVWGTLGENSMVLWDKVARWEGSDMSEAGRT